ncbi:class I SAM-dependent methyltransferase [Neisseriaceae bacterium ESL0693]|nr:class I SAM-dependent methyltransferase [Neisseriaceae bacterium ESL0693]
MSTQASVFSAELSTYLDSINPPEHPLLAQLGHETAQHRKGHMTIATQQVQLLVWLARLIQARFYLEIGVFTGHSSTAMAMALPDNGHITACDINVTYTDIAQHYWRLAGVDHKISLHLQPALITLKQLLAEGHAGHYDLALIDADKPPTAHYFEYCLKLVRPGGIIAIDNVLLQGRITQEPTSTRETDSLYMMRQFNASLKQDERIQVLTLPLGDGLTLIQKK